MKFYSTKKNKNIILPTFQFPTGWNSTLLVNLIKICYIVSSPNGMKFYSIYQSQRDRQQRFQFPTGWNSTRCRKNPPSQSSRFQFPTGWNSTQALCRKGFYTSYVSIPNGMEFYTRIKLRAFQKFTCFNSQRDGILHFGLRLDRSLHAFQFPTGWNSTS